MPCGLLRSGLPPRVRSYTEHLLKTSDRVSGAEEKSLAALAVALKATEADKRRRQAAAGAAQAKKQAEEQLQAQREAEAQKKAEEARDPSGRQRPSAISRSASSFR